MSEKRAIERRLRLLTDRLLELEARPDEPGLDDELGVPVIRFDLQFSETERLYSFAAIRCGERWYLTGNRAANGRSMTWDQLLDWMDGESTSSRLVGDIWLVTGYEALA